MICVPKQVAPDGLGTAHRSPPPDGQKNKEKHPDGQSDKEIKPPEIPLWDSLDNSLAPLTSKIFFNMFSKFKK